MAGQRTRLQDPAPRWTTLHPIHWTTTEVVGWVDSVIIYNNLRDSDVIREAFQGVKGTDLIKMKQEDFVSILGQQGDFMFHTFKRVYSTVKLLEDSDPQAVLRSLTPISEKTDSESSPEPETEVQVLSRDPKQDSSTKRSGAQTDLNPS